jgi:hypothetical protein
MSAERIFFIAPPQRQAIIELAVGYATFLNEEERGTIQSVRKAAKRLRDAQDAFGIELIERHKLDEKAIEGGMSDNLTEFLLIALQTYKQGHEAARCNLHPADCPFEYGSIHEVAWRNGWCDGSLGVDFERGAAEFQNMAEEEAA